MIINNVCIFLAFYKYYNLIIYNKVLKLIISYNNNKINSKTNIIII